MTYDFWDYFFGWLIILAFLIPFLGAIGIQVVVFLVAMLGGFFGIATSDASEKTIRVRLNSYDIDEDR